jgi:hypothetical protein
MNIKAIQYIGKRRKKRFFRNIPAEMFFVDDIITKPLIMKKSSTPKYPYCAQPIIGDSATFGVLPLAIAL